MWTFWLIFACFTSKEVFCVDDNIKEEIINTGDERPINSQDKISIALLTPRARIQDHYYTHSLKNEECVLKRFEIEKPVRLCQNFTKADCHYEPVLSYKNVTENCDEQKEFCQTFYREEKTSSDTFVCQTSPSVNCSDVEDELIQPRNTSEVHEEPEVCLPNFVSLCQTKPEIVTVTEQRQMCGVPKKVTATKICITYADGAWHCKNLTVDPYICDNLNIEKIITAEMVGSRLQCVEKNLEPTCHKASCQVSTNHLNKTHCIADNLPGSLELKETVCERCVDGRVKVRPVIEDKEICRNKSEEFCLDSIETKILWRKWCRQIGSRPKSSLRPTAVPADWTTPIYTSPPTQTPGEHPFFEGLTDRSVIQITTINPETTTKSIDPDLQPLRARFIQRPSIILLPRPASPSVDNGHWISTRQEGNDEIQQDQGTRKEDTGSPPSGPVLPNPIPETHTESEKVGPVIPSDSNYLRKFIKCTKNSDDCKF